ncbi:MAG: hypothetical protein KGM24_09410, partial [Elusimicrobia bacterium]|nr:hypothetical protein [Elusimicrobiota bacterium]
MTPDDPPGAARADSGVGVLAAAAFAWNFLTIGAYAMVGPPRGALIMTRFGPRALPWVYMGSAALTGLVVWAYERTARLPRRPLIAGWLALLAATMAAGAWAVGATHWRPLEFLYFLWTDVFGIMAVTLFWTCANDVFGPAYAPRVFGFVAAGAPLGAVAGAWLDERLMLRLGPVALLGLSAAVFAGSVPLFLFVESRARGRGLAGGAPAIA